MAISCQALSQECYDAFFGMSDENIAEIYEMYGLEGEFELSTFKALLPKIKSRFILGKAFYNHSAVQEDVWYVDPSNPAPFDWDEMFLFYGALDLGIMDCDIESEYAVLYDSDEAASGPF